MKTVTTPRPPDLYPFSPHWAEVEGCRVHFVEEGSGPPLLMLHGNPTWSFLYRDLIRLLKGEFRCIAPDLPGFGRSVAGPGYGYSPREHGRVVLGLIRALDLKDCWIMVQDWGGPVGLWAAAQEPERVAGLIIGNTWAWPVADDPHFARYSSFMGGPVGGFLIRHFNYFINFILPAGCSRRKPSKEVMDYYREPFLDKSRREPMRLFCRAVTGATDFLAEAEAGLARLRNKPALIVWGDQDIAFRAQERERFESLFANHRTVPLPGAGHFIQEDAPEVIAPAVIGWRRALERGKTP